MIVTSNCNFLVSENSPIGFFNGIIRNIFYTSLKLIYCSKSRGTAQAGGHQRLSIKVQVRLHASPCEIRTRKWTLCSGFPPSTSVLQC